MAKDTLARRAWAALERRGEAVLAEHEAVLGEILAVKSSRRDRRRALGRLGAALGLIESVNLGAAVASRAAACRRQLEQARSALAR